MFKRILYLCSFCFLYSMAAFATEAPQSSIKSKASEVTRTMSKDLQKTYYKISDKTIASISFEENSFQLSAADLTRLQALLEAHAVPEGKYVLAVAAWPDAIHPAGPTTNEAANRDNQLTDRRIKEIKKAISKLAPRAIIEHTYNMAREPKALEKLFSNRDEILDRTQAIPQKEAVLSAENDELRKLNQVGGFRKAVILIKTPSNS